MSCDELVEKLMQVPYVHRGRDFSGLDCYGLIIVWYREMFGKEIWDIEEEYTQDFAFKGRDYFIENYHREWVKESFPRKNSVVLFSCSSGVASHGGVVIRDNQFIHACRAGVVINKIYSPRFVGRIQGFYRLKNDR